MENRLTNGFIAGLLGGLAMNVFSLIDYYVIHGTNLMFTDWSAVMLYGERTQSLWGNIFAIMTQVLFTSLLGVIFAYIVMVIKDWSYIFKGWYYGVTCWLTIYGIDILLKLHDLDRIPVRTAVSNFIGSSIFGITLGYVLLRLDLRVAVKDREFSQKSEFKSLAVPMPAKKLMKRKSN